MYASLDRLDLGFELPEGRGVIFLQNDHRDPRTITEQASLSVIFAITRCLLAYQAALESGRRPFQVVYAMEGEPPSFLAYVVAAAGAVVTKGPPRELTVASAPRMGDLEKLIGDAVRQLAAESWTREDFEPSLSGLVAYEFRARYPESTEDPVAYYTRIVTLGALVASVLLPKLDDARWIHAPGVVPFALAGRHGDQEFPQLDVFGKAKRFVDHGLGDSPSAFVAAVIGEAVDLGDPFAAFTRLRGKTVRPEMFEARALAGSAADAEMRSTAEALAREAADAFRRWGLEIGDAIQWVTRPAIEVDMRPVGATLLALASSTYDDGHYEVFDRLEPFGAAAKNAIERHQFLDSCREDWIHEGEWRTAVILNRRVPADAPRFAGRRFHELPNPFQPLLAIWATGYLAESLDAHGITLVVVAPPNS